MAKKLANKRTKELMFDTDIKEGKSLYTASWQGRINVTDVEKSKIAKEVGITKEGEYAIKVR